MSLPLLWDYDFTFFYPISSTGRGAILVSSASFRNLTQKVITAYEEVSEEFRGKINTRVSLHGNHPGDVDWTMLQSGIARNYSIGEKGEIVSYQYSIGISPATEEDDRLMGEALAGFLTKIPYKAHPFYPNYPDEGLLRIIQAYNERLQSRALSPSSSE